MYRKLLFGWRVGFGALALLAISTQLYSHVMNELDIINFFSYFTVLSNMLAVVAFAISAFYMYKSKKLERDEEILRAMSVTAMTLVGLVYITLLRSEDLGSLIGWVNFVLHYLMPVAVLIDWLASPPNVVLRIKRVIPSLLVAPSIYLFYTILRGASTDWYPYIFLNPSSPGGYGGVALYSCAIFILFITTSFVLLRARSVASKRLKKLLPKLATS